MHEGPIGAASFNNEFGRPNLVGYFRTFEHDNRGYHKPIMLAGGIGNIWDPHTAKKDLPAGTFILGRDGGPAEQAPAHSVTVAPFAIDRTEARIDEFRKLNQHFKFGVGPSWSLSIVVADENHRFLVSEKRFGILHKTLKPFQLVVKLRPGCRIAIGEV